MIGSLLQPEIHQLIAERNFYALKDMIRTWPPADLAEVISEVSETDKVIVFRLLPRDLAADTFEYLDHEAQQQLLKAMGQEEAAEVLNEMSADDRTALLEELPGTTVNQLIRLLSPEERTIAQSLLGYPEDSVGRLMTPDYIRVKGDWPVKRVLDYIREHGQDSETLNVIYVVDDRTKLIGEVRLREFLLKPLESVVREFLEQTFVALKVTDDQEAAVEVFKRYDRTVLPVLDSEGVLMGIVTIDDMLDVAEKEATEDIQKLGGSAALEEPYLTVALPRMIRKRAGWLIILFVGEMLTATAMGFFEQEIARAVVLALFVPLIISSGGNSGSQATTIIIRAMAVGDVLLRDWWKVIRREVLSGLVLGLILGIIGFLRIGLWSAFSNLYGPHWFRVALTVGLSLIGVVMWGTLIGSTFPLLLRRLNFDPAVSSAPFVATLVDVTGIVIYFGVAILLLRGTLL